MFVRNCQLCSASFTANSPKKKHCSDSCRDRDRYNSDPIYKAKKKIRAKQWARANRDHVRKMQKEYYHAHWFEFAERNFRKVNRVLSAELVRQVMEDDDFTCSYCDQRGGKLTIDHKLPISRGGSDNRDNLCTACHACNCRKGPKTVQEFKNYLEELQNAES